MVMYAITQNPDNGEPIIRILSFLPDFDVSKVFLTDYPFIGEPA